MSFNIRNTAKIMIVAAIMLIVPRGGVAAEPRLKDIKLPPGFEISLYADVPNARSMALSPNGTVFVGSLGAGKVYAVPNRAGTNGARKAVTIAEGLNMPNGVAFRDGALYVAEVNRVLRYDGIGYRITLVRLENTRAVSYTTFAEGWLQGSKAWGRPVGVLVMPDGALLVSDDRAGAIYRIRYQ